MKLKVNKVEIHLLIWNQTSINHSCKMYVPTNSKMIHSLLLPEHRFW